MSRPRLTAALVSSALFMEAFDSTAIVQVLPEMGRSFSVSPVELSLGLTAYLLTMAVLTPMSGWLTDTLGARRVFCAAVAVFGIASALCGLSDSEAQFVATRILQGCGAGFMSSVGRIAILQVTPRHDLVRVVNLVATPGLLGTVLGPPLGGFIGEYASWRWIFLINVPIAVLGVLLALWFMPARRAAQSRSFDRAGLALNGVALFCLIYGMDRIAARDGDNLIGALVTCVGLAVGVVAVRHARRAEHPLVSLDALSFRTFSAINIGGQFFRLGIVAPIFVVPLMLQLGLGYSLAAAGLITLAHTFGDFVLKAVVRRLVRLLGFRTSLIWSAVLFAAMIASCMLFTPATPAWMIVAVMFFGGVVRSQHMTCQTTMQFAEIQPDQISAATTLSSMMMYLSRSLGIAVAAILLNLISALHGEPDGVLTLSDFRIVLLLEAAITLVSLGWFVGLPRDIGADVSGHHA